MAGNHDQKLREALQKVENSMPDQVRHRIDETLSSLPERNKKWKKPSMIAGGIAASLAILLGTGFTNTTMAQVLQSIPFVESVFKLAGDSTLKTTVEKGLAEKVNKSAADQGVTVTVSEAFYDGTGISVGYVVQSDAVLDKNMNTSIDFTIDGKRIENYGVGGSSERYDDHVVLGVMHLDVSEPLPNEFDLGMKIKKLGESEGEWNVQFPVREISSENKVILPVEKKSSGDITVILEKVTFAPTATEVVYKLKQPSDREMELSFELLGSNGEHVEPLSLFKKDDTFKVSYEPFSTIPETITFQPQSRHDNEIDQILEKLKITVGVN
ncbi:DUF4179 domain-containing protein [Heyndrickxia sp. MSNUG]|uniref:DUF4179 domain-containing protein n=1 Tax=Heyndrickxia sp. MSNUG TaxID=3136677 RepID=UPI003C2B57BC